MSSKITRGVKLVVGPSSRLRGGVKEKIWNVCKNIYNFPKIKVLNGYNKCIKMWNVYKII